MTTTDTTATKHTSSPRQSDTAPETIPAGGVIPPATKDTPVIENTGNPETILDAEMIREAREIYESGRFIEHCTTIFNKIWYGDAHILLAILLQTANLYVDNADEGIFLHVAGGTQSGKSDSVKTALKFIRPSNRISKTFSPMWIFYTTEIKTKMILFSDDTKLDKEVAALYRGVISNWHDGSERGTVLKGVAAPLRIPPRVSLILTSIESVAEETDEAQDESRFFTTEIRRTSYDIEQIKKFCDKQKKDDISRDLRIIHAVWGLIEQKAQGTKIKIPFDVKDELTLREHKRYMTLLRSHALLCNRTEVTESDRTEINKLITYSRPMIAADIAGLSIKQTAIIELLRLENRPIPVNEIADGTKLTMIDVYRALRGTHGSFENPTGGLLATPYIRAGKEVDPPYKWLISLAAPSKETKKNANSGDFLYEKWGIK